MRDRMGMSALQTSDPEIWSFLQEETERQTASIELIASENYTSPAVLEALGSIFTNKYAEGLPGKRYYGGNQVVDKLESTCMQRALDAFHLNGEEWGCNVQPYSGSVANMAVYLGLLKPHDRIMGLDLPSGGHLSHGYMTVNRRISGASVYYESIPYKVDANGFLEYDKIEELALTVKPRLIICGGSAYSRDWDYKRFRVIANKCGALLMADIAHISGFVATGLLANPFEVCDVVTTTTHKTLRGPRSAIIFFRKQYSQQINDAVFPGLQGGPHMNQIAAVAVQLKEVMTPEYKQYMKQVHENAKVLAECLKLHGFTIVTGGTDNHLFLVDIRSKGINGSLGERILEHVGISVNKNTIPGDSSALVPSGIRIGTPAITTKGYTPEHMPNLAKLINDAIDIAIDICKKCNIVKLKEFTEFLTSPSEYRSRLETLRKNVYEFGKIHKN